MIAGGSQSSGSGGVSQQAATNNVTSLHGGAAVALKSEPAAQLSPAQQLETRGDTLEWTQVEDRVRALVDEAGRNGGAKVVASERRAEAKAKGYEGEACGECQNFTLVRNGTCMKCDTCGSTTGCS